MNDSRKENVVRDAMRLMSAINIHLSETECRHTIRQITSEALDSKEVDFKSGQSAFVGTGTQTATSNHSPNRC